jgi:hypothetical protein
LLAKSFLHRRKHKQFFCLRFVLAEQDADPRIYSGWCTRAPAGRKDATCTAKANKIYGIIIFTGEEKQVENCAKSQISDSGFLTSARRGWMWFVRVEHIYLFT